ncbi:MAG: tRNA 2-thiouridine(34) synthase MnmA [Acidobacteriaceae bacterium]
MTHKPTVAVAMSGGVDSSVAAAILLDQGFSVVGLMLNLWSEPDAQRSNRCCTPDSVALARQVASKLSIPFYILDARQVFYDSVVIPFISDYAHNLTPNPCINCNRYIRWEFLLQHALAAGADFLATGHYARISRAPDGLFLLSRALDLDKDQSYVLHVLTQERLAHALFPLGGYTKPQVRQTARHYDLPVADRPDSQDLCFIGASGDYRQFLTRHAPQTRQPGEIIDLQGKVLGLHQGLAFYTIGQRKGLRISASQPQYVLEKDMVRNTLVVGPRERANRDLLIARDANWIAGNPPTSPFPAMVKIRYRAHDTPGTVNVLPEGRFQVRLENYLPDITPGQAAVLYNGDVCLGGGIITN